MENKQPKMFACKYDNEPADLKLMLIYFIKRIRFVLYFIIFGALIFAGAYYLKTFVLIEEKEYTATGELYLTYAEDVRLDNVYINDYTWQNLVHTDKVMERAMAEIEAKVSEEYLKLVVTAKPISDVRFVTLTVTTNDPELSVEIAQAFQTAIMELSVEMVDIDEITVFTEADEAVEYVPENRTVRMALTGAVIGGVAAMFYILLQFVFDDSIYIASQFERRFGIPVIGICPRNGRSELEKENLVGQKKKVPASRLWGRKAIKLNYKALTQGYKKIAVVDTSLSGKTEFPLEILMDAKLKLEQDELLNIATEKMKDGDAHYTASDYELFPVESINVEAEGVSKCAVADGVIILVEACAHNGKLLERAIDLLSKQGCKILGALIYDGDPSLLKMYYYEPILFRKKETSEEDEEDLLQSDADNL